MTQKKTGLTIDQHKELGARIKKIGQELSEVADIVGGAYGWSSRQGTLAEGMIRPKRAIVAPIFKLQVAMDEALFKDFRLKDWWKEKEEEMYSIYL